MRGLGKKFLLALLLVLLARSQADAAKYIFIFIGDGMGVTQVNTTEAFLAGVRERAGSPPRESQLNMTSMPVWGTLVTASKSGVTDSAAAATALSSGHKTVNGAIGMDPTTGERFDSILRVAKARGMRTGVVTTSFLQDATPAAFGGARTEKRKEHYLIGLELCEAGLDFLGGGGWRSPRGRDKKQTDLSTIAAKNGMTVALTERDLFALVPPSYPDGARPRDDIEPLRASRALAIHPRASGGYMPFEIDGEEQIDGLRLSDFTRRAIMMLDGDDGFVLMVEGGRIDIACHANDAAAAVRETIEFDEAVRAALEFAAARPDETLVVVTADHETGGMTAPKLDPARLASVLGRQSGSYLRFEGRVSPSRDASFERYSRMAAEWFGVDELAPTKELRDAFRMSMTPRESRPTKDKSYRSLYATYDPFTVAAVHQANASVGITWTTFYHTGKDVPMFASGVGAEAFAGRHDNTEVFALIRDALPPGR